MKTQTQTKYKALAVGDIRQEGDEVRHTGMSAEGKYGYHNSSSTDRLEPGPWTKVSPGMFGHVILPADVIVGEFQRPIK